MIDGTTALMYAATYRGNAPYLSLLLDVGADGRLKSQAGNTAYVLALQNPKLAGADVLQRLKQAQFGP